MTRLDTEESSRVADDAKDQGSSSATVRSVEEPNSSNRCEAGVTTEDLAIAEFDSVEEAYVRYVEYARVTGFAVRKGDSGRDNEGNVVRKFFFCNREGLRDKKHYERIDRQRAHKPITRTNSNARFLVHLDKGCGKLNMKSFVVDHNHELAPADHTNVMAPHRHMSEGDKAHVHSLHEAGFQTTQIMGFFAYLAGGYRNLHFIKKDLYNYIDDVRRSRIVEGDTAAAISYLKGKIELNSLVVVQYSYCAENHLGNLFWCDGQMQHDYDCFGDVLAFDSTYRKNLYNRPLVIISGTNHHRQTIIFGFGLLEDEKIPSYKWLLRSFLDVMRQKEPMVVVTDGDKSMKKAIRSEFPNATHRPCSWHLAWNVVSNIKDANFCSAFKTAVYGNFVVEEFENYWAEMVESFGLENNDWIEKTYEKRAQWANAYLCDKFCARVRTTLRCEGINSSLKKFIRSGNCLLELVENLDRVVKDYQNNEFMADFKCLYSEPVMTTGLESIEKAVSKVYTREIFFEVKKQIESVAALLVLHHETYGTIQKFMLRKFRRPLRVYTILYNSSSKNYECSCKLWNSLGVPCSHIFCAMKELEIEALPRRLVLRRSCKDAKTLEKVGAVPMADPEKAFRERYGSMWSALAKLTKEIESAGPRGGRNRFRRAGDDHVNMLDPTIVKSKGAPRGSTNAKIGRRCRRCNGLGHDRRNCTARNEQPDDEVVGTMNGQYQTSCKRV
ncbi:protein FAR1-RELATED SEQUENCE 5-like [Arachis hypogaea]|uniref:protein FAR1-RELATED SEQUENCE 5-like n=1 Tax=Arachis hypogaea TaxID=3818 RepID=UPI000DED4EDB|nr:protein FAR1-RELATED SEQUENCE 5-like [Arachis hypogaea]